MKINLLLSSLILSLLSSSPSLLTLLLLELDSYDKAYPPPNRLAERKLIHESW